MKKILPLVLIFIGFISSLQAQWTSPGNGTTYTMSDLVAAANGNVTNDGTEFTIRNDLTISANDVLVINDEVTKIDAPGVLITIKGTIQSTNTMRVPIYGTMDNPFSMRFENATECELNKMYFSDGAGIQVIESQVAFIDCKFLYFTTGYCSAVVNFMNCNPRFQECIFMINDGPAISSPANGHGSPYIVNCTFDENVKEPNTNNPQVNLGPGGDDTIRIIGNTFDGTFCQATVGGLSISDLIGTGATKVLLKDNIIKKHRYGYNQQGMTISSVIKSNQFIDNNKETNPMNGGSGISIYGLSENCQAILRDNTITGNLWGITAIYMNHIDLGTEDDWGHNAIYDNGNGGVIYDLYNNSSNDITAVGNNWGTTDEQEVEDHIYHQADDASLGLVTYIPYIGYESVSEHEIGVDDLNASDVILYSINGQRVGRESLKPGAYILVKGEGSNRIAKKIIIQ